MLVFTLYRFKYVLVPNIQFGSHAMNTSNVDRRPWNIDWTVSCYKSLDVHKLHITPQLVHSRCQLLFVLYSCLSHTNVCCIRSLVLTWLYSYTYYSKGQPRYTYITRTLAKLVVWRTVAVRMIIVNKESLLISVQGFKLGGCVACCQCVKCLLPFISNFTLCWKTRQSQRVSTRC